MIINNRYEVGQQIGEGTQGSILCAVDKKLNKQVVLKVFDITSDLGTLGFATEVLIQKKVSMRKSTHVCEMLDCFKLEQCGIIVMEKYRCDLFDYCFDNQVKQPVERVKELFYQICLGVRDLHRNGVAHMDLKPENILIDKDGKAALCDFGGSHYSRDKKRSLKSLKKNRKSQITFGLQGRGTKRYSAPEVAHCAFDPYQADIYSLGVILHVIITGFFPNGDDLAYAATQVDADCLSLLQNMLHSNPQKRSNIEEVLSEKWLSDCSNNHTLKRSLSSKFPGFFLRL